MTKIPFNPKQQIILVVFALSTLFVSSKLNLFLTNSHNNFREKQKYPV